MLRGVVFGDLSGGVERWLGVGAVGRGSRDGGDGGVAEGG